MSVNATSYAPSGSVDVRTDEGLREALVILQRSGDWEGHLGQLVLRQLFGRCYVVVRNHEGPGLSREECRDQAQTLLGNVWERLRLYPDSVIGADRPWAVITTVIRGSAHQERVEQTWAATKDKTREKAHWMEPPVRYGLPGERLATKAVAEPPPRNGAWGAALDALHRELVEAGAPPKNAAEAIDGALDVIGNGTRKSWIHTRAYRDSRLRQTLTRDQIRALIDLLIGSRRDGAEGSAWLALRRAVQTGQRARLADVHPQSIPKVRTLVGPWLNTTPTLFDAPVRR